MDEKSPMLRLAGNGDVGSLSISLISLAILPEAASREGLRIAKHGPRSMN